MMQPLPIDQASKIEPLFQRLMQSQPMCTAVLEGIYPGRVYVDNPAQPRSALLTTYIESAARGMWCFLAGEPINDAFNRSLNAAIFSRQIMADNTPVLFLTCDPDDWGGQMDAVVAPRPPIWIPRYHFVSQRVGFDWRAALPTGFTVEPMNQELHKLPGIQMPEDVAATLSKCLQWVHWTCDANNPGSVGTAEKLALERMEDYRQAVLLMNEKSHMAFFQRD